MGHCPSVRATSPELAAYRVIGAAEGANPIGKQLDVPTMLEQLREQSVAVKRGEMRREVRGPGTLVPKEVRWIAAETAARVDRIERSKHIWTPPVCQAFSSW